MLCLEKEHIHKMEIAGTIFIADPLKVNVSLSLLDIFCLSQERLTVTNSLEIVTEHNKAWFPCPTGSLLGVGVVPHVVTEGSRLPKSGSSPGSLQNLPQGGLAGLGNPTAPCLPTVQGRKILNLADARLLLAYGSRLDLSFTMSRRIKYPSGKSISHCSKQLSNK